MMPSHLSIQAHLLAIFISGVIWLLINLKTEAFKTLYASFIAIAFLYIILIGNRTAFLSILATVIYCIYPHIKPKRKKLFLWIGFSLLAISGSLLAFSFKQNSTSGRFFILQRSLSLFKQHWLTGVGYGKYNPSFNHEQANYFSTHSLTSKQEMLADDGYYAFNEWLHIGIEWGVFGLLVSLLITFIVLKTCIQKIATKDAWAGAGLVAVFVSCMFSYPLHNIYIIGIAAFLTGYITSDILVVRIKLPRWFWISFFSLVIISLCFFVIRREKVRRQFREAKELAIEGNKTNAIEIYIKNEKSLKGEYGYSLLYLQLLYETNRLKKAEHWFEKMHEWHCNQRAHSIIAKVYEESGDPSNAEKNYLTSLYITPALLQSRMNLLQFYDRQNAIDKAKYWANEIITCPVKITSNNKAYILKEHAEKYLLAH